MIRPLFFFLAALAFTNACLDNYGYRFASEWRENGKWKTNAYITPDFSYKLKSWELHLEFNEPLAEDLQAWVARGSKGSKGKSKLTLKPMSWNRFLDPTNFEMSYFVYFKNKQGQNHLKCAEFCGIKRGTTENICVKTSPNTKTTSATTATPPPPVATTKPTTTTKSPVVTTKASITTTTSATTKSTATKSTPTTTPPPTTTTTTKSPVVTTKASITTTTSATTKSTATKSTSTTTTPPPTTTATTTNPRPCESKYNYTEVLEKSLLFYEAQRSGKLPLNQRVKWRRDSTMSDGAEAGIDLTGGYFDAAYFVKFGFPMAATITNLAWGMLEFIKKGYESAGQYEYGLDAIKWGTDYFMKCHTAQTMFVGQVGDGDIDHAWWGRPEDMTLVRPVYAIDQDRPGSELAAETSAALAASYLLFRDQGDLSYALNVLKHAKELYTFAMTYRGTYHESIPDAKKFYQSWSGYNDELAWASLWLFRATGEQVYKENFINQFEYEAFNNNPKEFSWDNKWFGVKILAQQLKVTGKNYLGKFKAFLQEPKKTPKGLFFVQKWGANRHAANLAFLARVASTLEDADFYNDFARGQIHYMLGDAGRSYIVGFGNNPPLRPHHKSSSCPSTGPCGWKNFESKQPNLHILYGALVGGPDNDDRYTDNRVDYVKNEVACDYNAGFQSAVAGLLELKENGQC